MNRLLWPILLLCCACTTISSRETIIYYGNNNLPQSEVELVDGKRSGNFTVYYPDGKKKISCKEEVFSEVVTCSHFYRSGITLREYSHRNQIFQGSYKEFYENGAIYINGAFHNSERQGVWQFFSPESEILRTVHYNRNLIASAEPVSASLCPALTEEEKQIREEITFKIEQDWCRPNSKTTSSR